MGTWCAFDNHCGLFEAIDGRNKTGSTQSTLEELGDDLRHPEAILLADHRRTQSLQVVCVVYEPAVGLGGAFG